jgi:hypothetical protein
MKLANFVTGAAAIAHRYCGLEVQLRSREHTCSQTSTSLGSEGQPGFASARSSSSTSVSRRDDHEHTCQDGASRHA